MTSSTKGVVYPPGVRELSEDISTDDLVRRLKECAQAFQSMAQEVENAQIYEPLAHLLISERFLEHERREVRLLVACCLADIFRVSAPDAPYKDEYQIKMILEFFIDQLKGSSNPDDPSFKSYFYLLENLSVVKTFNVCFDLQDSQMIVCRLFKLMFKLISDHQFLKLQRIIVDLLCPLINEADLVPAELINIIFNHIIEPMKSRNKNACILAQEILRKTGSSIGTYVQAYFTNEFYLGEPTISERLCDLIYELNSINHGMMAFVIPQLESKLRTCDEKERLMVTKLVAKMFSDRRSNMIEEYNSLWNTYLGRFHDISVNVRLLCIKFAHNFLLHHPESREDITVCIKQRSHDPDEEVRFHAVSTVLSVAKQDITCLNKDIFAYVKERALDKKFRIRKESLLNLGKLYKQYLLDLGYVNPVAAELLDFVEKQVFYGYYQPTIGDKCLVERILHTCLIPYHNPMRIKMRMLYKLYCNLDQIAARAFKEILKNQRHLRMLTNGVLEIIQQKKPEKQKLLEAKVAIIAKNLGESKKSADSIYKFCQDLESNIRLRGMMSVLLNGNITCSEAEEKVKDILRLLGEPVMTNTYYTSIKQLLERIVPVLLDKESVKYLVAIVKNSILGDKLVESQLQLENSGSKGLQLINALASTYPSYFADEELLSKLVQILQADDSIIAEITLETFSNISKDLENTFPKIYCELLPVLEHFIELGTPKQAKHAVYTVFKMVNDKETVFSEILQNLRKHYNISSQYFRTALVSVGHIAFLCHDMFASQFKTIVAKTVVKELMLVDHDFPRGGTELWGPFESLPYETKVKVEGMKLMVRWLLGLKDMVQPANSTFKLLNAVIKQNGDLMVKKCIGPVEGTWMRFSAAKCFLNLCQEPVYAESLPIDCFLNLAYIMNDPCIEVREQFAAKVNKGLYYMKLPLEFIAILAVGGLDSRKDFRNVIKQYLYQNINKRKQYFREYLINSADEFPYVWPDYSLPIVVYLLAHAPFFKVYNDAPALHQIRDCIQLFLDALIHKNSGYSFSFFKRLLENIKQTKDKLKPDDKNCNLKLYAVCDLALQILMSKTTITLKDFPGQPKLNSKFFTEPDKSYSNFLTYLPQGLLNKNIERSGFDVALYEKTEEQNASKSMPNPSESQKKPLSSTSRKEVIPSIFEVETVPSVSEASLPCDSNTEVVIAASNHSNYSLSELKNKADAFSDESASSIISWDIKQSETSNPSGTDSRVPTISDVSSESTKNDVAGNSRSSVINLNSGNIGYSDTISSLSDDKLDTDSSTLKKDKMNGKSKSKSFPKKGQSVATRKSTRSTMKNSAHSSLSFENSKQNGSTSLNGFDSLYSSDCENFIKPCSVLLKRIEYSDSEISSGSISIKRKHGVVNSEDNSSNQRSSAGSHLSEEETPQKRSRRPKENGKSNENLSSLPLKKRFIPARSAVKNGKHPEEKKSKDDKSKSSISKKMNSIAKVREELNAEINEIYQKTSSKAVKNKQANRQQNRKK